MKTPFLFLAAALIFAILSCAPVITSSSNMPGVQGKTLQYQITATTNPRVFGATVPPPDGLMVDTKTGIISGVPKVAGTFNATILASNSFGKDVRPLLINIDPAPHKIIRMKELLIIAPAVVRNDPRTQSGGVWHIRSVMQRIAGSGVDVDAFAHAWIDQWVTVTDLNGDEVQPRAGTRDELLAAWRENRFQLIAIVNRLDLTQFQDNDPTKPLRLGEGRFVFEVVDASGKPRPFTVIFEFGLPAVGADISAELTRWARRWHHLGNAALGDENDFGETYLAALQAITDEFSSSGRNLNQVRTNEILQGPWELREFKLAGGALKQSVVALTPAERLNGQPELVQFINSSAQLIVNGTYQIPEAMGGAFAHAPRNWAAPGAAQRERFIVSFNTCNGCHSDNTGTGFQHIFRGGENTGAALSPFMREAITIAEPLPPESNETRVHDEMFQRETLLGAFTTDEIPGFRTVRSELLSLLAARGKRVH